MSRTTMTYRDEHIRVVDEHGRGFVLLKRTPIQREVMLDGSVIEHEKLATITMPSGEHVNHRSDTEFETISGKKLRLVQG